MLSDQKLCGELIAIVGSACRFPGGATDPAKLWQLLKEPRDVLTEIPESRFNVQAFYHPDGSHHGTSNVRHSYLLSEDHRLFDAQFFGTKPVEANSIDPQQRLLLETVYEGLESAGIPMERLQGSDTGVYVGLMTNDYADLLGRDIQNFPTYFASGTARSILSNRVSYFFDWHGPSMTIDTACSSSLIAVHQAVLSLRNGESRVAVAAGTNLLLGPEQYVAESKLKMLSPTGRSRMWDKDADGYARGDGIAAVILKPLSAALADGDHIECLIRETGINQDGRTKGITMPNPVAQADLIRSTYARAGLDLSKPSDRPQYFEAHGTGTPAGDPVEAEAISVAFFGPTAKYHRRADQESPLYVGSIKTVIGHTEGTAGLAAVLKASLALQHAVIPPNLLLNELNPSVRPFYNDLHISSTVREWPRIPSCAPRRASVNSFGFGGANAHAILESFEPQPVAETSSDNVQAVFTPFNFSASSENSLVASLKAYSVYLKDRKDVNFSDLSWTLNCRRSTLPVRLSVAASSLDDLTARIDKAAETPSDLTPATQTSSVSKPKILGVFTGQGAQWAGMGADLLGSSSLAADCIARLDSALQTLPVNERPAWSLRDELLKDASSSRIGEALFSQTLCTAVQIMLVGLLRAAGISFTAVVGHSSGEIAAAYAAGYLSENDAIRIAYYRGWSLQNTPDRDGVQGAMMAVGTSIEDAKELCGMPSLEGRICVAASNSSASVTLSGDADAIEEAKEIFEDEKKFARLLKVDKAYHSHHMLPCAAPYIEAIQKCAVKVQDRSGEHTKWISSVYSKDIDDVNDSLTDTYWSNNMVNPVMFAEAVSFAVAAAGPFHMALEVGPHPALKGPAMQTIQEVSGNTLPYSGALNRGKSARESFASMIGALWISLGEHVVDFANFQMKAAPNSTQPKLLKGLPAYSWDHDRIYWHESRVSNTFRAGTGKFHPLLGVKCPDGTDNELRWRNYLNPKEIPWLAHHQVQGQMIFPAAGYISAATEMVIEQYELQSVQLIDFHDAIIGQALVLEENTGVEVIFVLTVTQKSNDVVHATFNCYSDAKKGSSSMSLHASSHLQILLGAPSHESLPSRTGSHDRFLELDSDRFYTSVAELGFGYTGPFQALSSLSRKMDEAIGLIAVPAEPDNTDALIVHPASLDGAIQSIMLAYCFPGDGRLRTLYLPTKVDRIRINPFSCVALAGPGSDLPFYSAVADARFAELSGDVDIYSTDGKYTVVQLQGLHTTPLTPLTSATDVPMFTEMTWAPEQPTGRDMDNNLLAEDGTLSLALERLAHFYLTKLSLSGSELKDWEIAWNHRHLLTFARHCTALVESGQHPFARSEWTNETDIDISTLLQRHKDSIDVKIMTAVGEALPAVIRGETNLLDTLMNDNLLSQFYSKTFGIEFYQQEVARIAGQISNRFPHVNVLEIGAGLGETTEYVLQEMHTTFSSYTFTDFMDTQFDSAQEKFEKYQARMAFKVLDIEKDPLEQGYGEESYDVIIASLALHATKNLGSTLANVRRLLKPGGFLLLLEVTEPNVMRMGLVLGGLPGWWLGHEEGRTLSPCVSVQEWSDLMSKAGFSGVDVFTPHHSELPVPFSVVATQAVDDRVSFLRNPTSSSAEPLGVESLTIIGGKVESTATLVTEIRDLVEPHYDTVKIVASLENIALEDLPMMGTVLSLAELDEPAFVSMTAQRLKSLQELFRQSKNILWVVYGSQGDNPYAQMFLGVQRTLVTEMNHLRVQSLNLHSLQDARSDLIAKMLLQLEATDVWYQDGRLNDLLWNIEPEVTLREGQVFIPRLRFSPQRNDRYNSSKRLKVDAIVRDNSVASVRPSDRGYQVIESPAPTASFFADRIEVQVTNSLLRSVSVTESESLFLVTGKDTRDNSQVIALSDTLDSRVQVPASWAVKCGQSTEQALRSMLSLYVHFLSQSMMKKVSPGKILAVLDPDFSTSAALSQYANQRGVQVALITTKESSSSSPWIYIHRHSTRRELLSKIPRNIGGLLNVGGDEDVMSMLKTMLPTDCHIENEQTLTEEVSRRTGVSGMDQIVLQLHATWTKAFNDQTPVNVNRLPKLGLGDLIKIQRPSTAQAVIDWDSPQLPVQIQPATKVVKFAKDKTYWLVGLTGGLGLSLCQWMARQGARYIALSSRNPKVDDRWIQAMGADGCTVRVFANDITDRESVYSTYRQILGSMPTVGGVAQGAMVLKDTMFFDLDLDRYDRVVQPKVTGSLLLDELFPENTLDFMIFFSSMAAMTGNPGQLAYNAANMFMTSLAAQRRSRGSAGQAINLGAIVGNGYVTRELNMGQQSYLYRVGHSWMSEQDFLEVFAEGVLSCLNGLTGADPCSSLRIDDDESKQWASNPIYQHLVSKSNTLVAGDKKSKTGVMIKTRLLEATSHNEVMEVLQESFTLKLQSALQTDPSKSILDLSPDEIGVDSLIALDLRSWFLKELGVDIPVLKIFNAALIRDLLELAAGLLPASLIPNASGDGQPSETAADVPEPDQQTSVGTRSTAETPVKIPETAPGSDQAEEVKTFHLGYLPSYDGSGSSAASLQGGDSSSGHNDTSSSTSLENDIEEFPKREVQRTAPMSFGQSRFWFLKMFVPNQTAFNVTPTFELTGKLRIEDLAHAVETVGQHHQALRTFFFTDVNKRPMQGVWAKSTLYLEQIKIHDRKEVEIAASRMKAHVFNIAEGEIVRVQLLSLAPDQHWLIFGFHHINMDGISFEVLWSELLKAYQGIPLSQGLQYPDFVQKQLQEYEGGAWVEHLAFWQQQFSVIPAPIPLLQFSIQPVRPTLSSYQSHWVNINLERGLVDNVEKCSRTFKVTSFHFYLATWQILLLRQFNIDDICVGLGDSGRIDNDALQSIGLYLNLLPVRFYRKESQSFGEALKDTKSAAQNAFAHSRVPFDVILSELNVPRSAAYNPLFQVFFNYRRVDEFRDFCGCEAKGSLLASGETSYDLHLDIADLGDQGTQVHMLVQKDLYAPEHAEILLRSYCNLLRAFTQNPATRVTWPPLFADEDIEQALSIGRGLEMQIEWPATVVHRVDEISRTHPNHPALQEENGAQFTYAQVKDRIAVIANELLNRDVVAGARVGVFQSPSADWICSMLAILRVGATYVPLDKKVGMNRLAAIVYQSNLQNVLVDTSTVSDYPFLQSPADPLDVSSLGTKMDHPVPNLASPSQTAVMMFTSGSTGTPKGILIGHSAYVNHVQAFSRTCGMEEGREIILHQSSYAWDMSLYQILVSLCNAATLVVASSSTRGDPIAISQLIASSKVTTTFATPTEYLAWFRFGREILKQSNLTTAVSGGEFVSNGLIKEFQELRKSDLRLINVYGPAETTLACTIGEVSYMQIDTSAENSSLRLYTLPNYSVYIVDGDLKPVPLGVPGEVVVGGAGIAKGYLDNDKTELRFQPDRHSSSFFKSQGWSMIHRTGDRAKLTPDGGLILLGRIDGDNQIKLGGIRINVEEIEATLVRASNGAISQAVVSARSPEHGDASQPFLVAFVVLAGSYSHDNQTDFLQQVLQDSPLPQYMRPAAVIPIHAIPQNTSGKVDRLAVKELPIPKLASVASNDESLVPLEETLRQLWKEVIPPEVVSLYSIQSHSDFFHVGGSSLSLVTLQDLVKGRLGISVPLHALFEASTLREMAHRIQNFPGDESGQAVDWEEEIESLLDSTEAVPRIDTTIVPSGTGVVVLTGATGFIGKEIVRQLVEDDQVQTIYCIAVRRPLAQLRAIFANPKVHVYHGDLTADQLGLADSDAVSIFSQADVVIHNGADVSFMKAYQTLKMSNVASTQELVKLALPRQIPIHFVSSASVTRLASQDSFGESSLAAFSPPPIPTDGYTAVKWVSEVYLERVSARFGIPVWIHRPSSVTGTDAPELDLMSNVIRYCQEIKKIPDSGSWSGVFDFISVESAAAQIIEAVGLSGASQSGTDLVHYKHESGEIQLGQNEVQSLMETGTGQQFDVVPVEEWVDHAEKAGMSNLLGTYLRRASAGQVLLPRLIKGNVEGLTV